MDNLEDLYQEFIDEIIEQVPLVQNQPRRDRDILVNQRVINNIHNVRRRIELSDVHTEVFPSLNNVFSSMFEVLFDPIVTTTATEEFEDVKVTLSPKEFSKFPCITLNETDRQYFSKDCNICIESYTAGDTIVQLPCEHIFHRNCISNWLLKEKINCPVCRSDVRKDNNK